MGIFKTIINRASGLLFPPRCPVCDCIQERGKLICDKCAGALPYVRGKICIKCGKPTEGGTICTDCKKGEHCFTQARAVWVLDGGIKDAVYRFKFENRRDYAKFLAKEALKRQAGWIEEIAPDAIVAVPMHKEALKERGYNPINQIVGYILS
mgnify:CR=1 FL=1